MNERVDVAWSGSVPPAPPAQTCSASSGCARWCSKKSRDVYDLPRAFQSTTRSCAVPGLGAGRRNRAVHAPIHAVGDYGVGGRLIKSLGIVPPPFPLGWPPNMVFTQPRSKRRCARMPVPGLQHGGAGAEVVDLARPASRDAYPSRRKRKFAFGRSRYVVGCDGAWEQSASPVRVAVRRSRSFDESWLVVDLHVNERGSRSSRT